MKNAILAASLLAFLSGGCSVLVDLEGLSARGGGGGSGGTGGGTGGGGGIGGGIGGGGGGVGPFTFTDDALEGEFGLGTNMNTKWAADRLVLDGMSATGVFRSRIFDAGGEATWETLSWRPASPYQKPLPATRGVEKSYPEGAIDMAGNLLLYPFDDGIGQLANGAKIDDASGETNHGTVLSAAGVTMDFEEGAPIGKALRDGMQTSLATGAQWVEPVEDDFTWALWAKSTANCGGPSGNDVYMGTEEGSAGAHVWLGCADATSFKTCSVAGVTGGRAAGVFISDHTINEGIRFCGTSQINDGAWHHLAAVKQGHAQSTVVLYVDGKVEATVGGGFVKPIVFPSNPNFTIGSFLGGYQTEGSFDEIAMWSRALSAAEITAIWRRGAMRLSLAVRACNDPTCADDPKFVGPNGDAEPFLDPAGALGPPGDLPLVLPKGRYFQYEARMSTFRVTDSPALLSVTVKGQR